MKEKKEFYNRRNPVAMGLAMANIAISLLALALLFNFSKMAFYFCIPLFAINCTLSLAWILRHRSDTPYLVVNEFGLVANGVIKCIIPWKDIQGFDFFILRPFSGYGNRNILKVALKDLEGIRHAGPFSWLLHQIPLAWIRLRDDRGAYQLKLRSYALHNPQGVEALLQLRNFLQQAQNRNEAVSGPLCRPGINTRDGEIILPNPISTSGLIVRTVAWISASVLVILIWNEEPSFKHSTGLFILGVVSLNGILPLLLFTATRAPRLETHDKGIILRDQSETRFIEWQNVRSIGFAESDSKSGGIIIHYDSLYIDVHKPEEIHAKPRFGRFSKLVMVDRLGEKHDEHDIVIGNKKGRRFPIDIPTLLLKRREQAERSFAESKDQ